MRWLKMYLSPDPAGGQAGGGGDPGAGSNPPHGGGQPDPGAGKGGQVPPSDPVIDPNKISESARLEQAKAFGFNSVEEMKAFISQSRQAPAGKGDPDTKELMQKLEISQKNEKETSSKLHNTLKENAFHTAFASLGVQLHDINDFKGIALGNLDVVDGDQVVVKNATGDIVLNSKGERMGVGDHLKQIIDSKPWMVKNTVKPGPGINPGSGNHDMKSEVSLETLKQNQVVSLNDFQEAIKKK